MIKVKTLNPEIRDKSEWFHKGTMIWGYGGKPTKEDFHAYYIADDMTEQQWDEVKEGWQWLEDKYNKDNIELAGEMYEPG